MFSLSTFPFFAESHFFFTVLPLELQSQTPIENCWEFLKYHSEHADRQVFSGEKRDLKVLGRQNGSFRGTQASEDKEFCN